MNLNFIPLSLSARVYSSFSIVLIPVDPNHTIYLKIFVSPLSTPLASVFEQCSGAAPLNGPVPVSLPARMCSFCPLICLPSHWLAKSSLPCHWLAKTLPVLPDLGTVPMETTCPVATVLVAVTLLSSELQPRTVSLFSQCIRH